MTPADSFRRLRAGLDRECDELQTGDPAFGLLVQRRDGG
jgi:hypothetical protein